MKNQRKLPRASRPDSDRRVRQADRLARLLRILERIQGQGQWTAKELARDEECSDRTIFRALQTLELAGVPWFFDETEKRYRVRPDYRFPILNLNEPQLIAHTSTAALSRAVGLSDGHAADPVTAKLKSMANEQTAKLIEDAERLISVLGLQMADHSRHHEDLRTAQWALVQRKQLTGRYKSPYEQKPVQLRLHPYRLCLIKQAWYLIGSPGEHEAPRTYRIARFRSLRMLDAAAVVPEAFDLQAYFGDAWAVFRGDKKHDVEIEFSPEAADLVTETIWHHSQKVKRLKNGSVQLRFRVNGLNEIVHWVLSWSGRAKVNRPVELRDLLVGHLQKALELHQP